VSVFVSKMANRASGRNILLSSSYIEGVGELERIESERGFRSARRRKLTVAAAAAVAAAGGRGGSQCYINSQSSAHSPSLLVLSRSPQ
jgi:hypothetical protein